MVFFSACSAPLRWFILGHMTKPILYAGDTALQAAASYLAGIMSHYRISFDYLASDQKFVMPGKECRLLILSDYPCRNFVSAQVESIAERVRDGMGLLMIGGWESFTGEGGDFRGTAIGDVLPVSMLANDDRVNCAQPCLVERNSTHPIVQDLPFDEVSPSIGGFNRVVAKPEGRTILSARRVAVRRKGKTLAFAPNRKADPLLVAGVSGKGRVAAFASDVAPHWVGGLVDWGITRITACADGAHPVEVGNWYAQFFNQMIRWTAALQPA